MIGKNFRPPAEGFSGALGRFREPCGVGPPFRRPFPLRTRGSASLPLERARGSRFRAALAYGKPLARAPFPEFRPAIPAPPSPSTAATAPAPPPGEAANVHGGKMVAEPRKTTVFSVISRVGRTWGGDKKTAPGDGGCAGGMEGGQKSKMTPAWKATPLQSSLTSWKSLSLVSVPV